MRILALALLWITAILTGGCSVYFIGTMGDLSYFLSLPGLAVCAIAILIIRRMSRPADPPPTRSDEDGLR